MGEGKAGRTVEVRSNWVDIVSAMTAGHSRHQNKPHVCRLSESDGALVDAALISASPVVTMQTVRSRRHETLGKSGEAPMKG